MPGDDPLGGFEPDVVEEEDTEPTAPSRPRPSRRGMGGPLSRSSRPSLDEAPPASRRSSAFFYRLSGIQVRRPLRVLSVAVVLVAVSLGLALQLRVLPGFEHLLPEGRESVQELDRVKQYTTGVSTIMIVLEGDDTEGLRKAADAITAEVAKIGPPWVGYAESGVHDAYRYLRPRAGLYADVDKLTDLYDDLEERWDYEVGKETGAWLDLDDEYEPPDFDADSLRERFSVEEADTERYPGGYYQSEDGKTLVVALRSGVMANDYEDGVEAIAKVRQAIERVDPKSFHSSIRYGLTGDLVTSVAAFETINDDLTDVGLLGAIFITSVVFLYYLRFRTLTSMLITISIGVLCTFGATWLLVGKLNLATGFLFTIIAGNGINPGIIYMARYLEARRRGADNLGAIREAHRETWLPTLTASCAASAAYASLLVTEFRGFRDFGIIGGVGMVLCWCCTFAFLPSILTMFERLSPFDRKSTGILGRFRNATRAGTRFGIPFAAAVARAPRLIAVLGVLSAIGAAVASVWYIYQDPMEYDLTHLRSDMSARAEEVRLTKLAEGITGFVGIDGMAILVDDPKQVPELVAKLRAVRDAAPEDAKPFKDVYTLQDFIPDHQLIKLPVLYKMKKRLLRAHKRKYIEKEDFTKIEPYLPSGDSVRCLCLTKKRILAAREQGTLSEEGFGKVEPYLPETEYETCPAAEGQQGECIEPFSIYDLPGGLAQTFAERDLGEESYPGGRRGRVVYISPISSEAVDDARYLFQWADSYRRTELDDGSVVLGSGRAVIYADMWAAVLDDVPKAVVASLSLTLLVVLLAFRAGGAAAAVMAALLAGVAWMTGMLVVGNVKINFLNFIALPITFGIGVDYAVNIMQRYRREGRGGALTAVRETGGAVVLCSMTTTLGYLALVSSLNFAVRSLGIAAVLGEIACLFAAVLTLPAALVWLDTRRQRRASRPPPSGSSLPSAST